MAEFTQQQIHSLGDIAIAFISETGRSTAHFLGKENGDALFGVTLNVPKGCKVGLPVFVSVDTSGRCCEITDLDKCIRLHKIMRDKS